MTELQSQPGVAMNGAVHGGQQPVVGATIKLYAAGSGSSDGSASQAVTFTPISPVTTDASGKFSITNDYTCPSGSAEMYITATGGNPGLGGGINPNLAMMAALGPCGSLTPSTFISINEVTTVASISALKKFMLSMTALGSGPNDNQQLIDAFSLVNQLVNNATGLSPGPTLPGGSTVPTAALYSLSDAVAACVNSSGGSATDTSTPCGVLFAAATPPVGPAPTDTIGALINIFNNPTRNISQIFSLVNSNGPFQSALSTAPTTWAMKVTPGVTVSLSPKNVTLNPGITQQYAAAIANAPDASAQWVVDGVVGGNTGVGNITASGLYTAPTNATVSNVTHTITAISNWDPSVSDTASAAVQPSLSVAVQNAAGSSFTVGTTTQFTATITNTYNAAIFYPANVTWSLSGCAGSCGTITGAGLYTAPAAVPGSSVTIVATSIQDPRQSGSTTITIVGALGLSISPGAGGSYTTKAAVSLATPSNTVFTATITNDTTNSGVTWVLTCSFDGNDPTTDKDCVRLTDLDSDFDNSTLSDAFSTFDSGNNHSLTSFGTQTFISSTSQTNSVTLSALPNLHFSGHTLSSNTILILTVTTVANGPNGQPITVSVTINITN